MKWVWVVLALLIVVVLVLIVVVVIGVMLPARHKVSHMARFAQPAEVVFAAVSGPQDWRGVNRKYLDDSGIMDQVGPPVFKEKVGWHEVIFTVVINDPPHRFGTRIADPNAPFSGSWTWEIADVDGGCTCRITEDGSVNNPVFRIVGKYLVGYTKTIDDYLNALGKKFGERVKIEE